MNFNARFHVLLLVVLAAVLCSCSPSPPDAEDLVGKPYLLDTGLESRSISFENTTGERGSGGKASSWIGTARKGAPSKKVLAGEEVQLCDITGAGTIRHIWITTSQKPQDLRSIILRVFWDDQEHPSIECPVGDFFGFSHGKVKPYQSAVHSVGELAGMNIWLPMPFTKRARIYLINEAENFIRLFYQIDYTIGDIHPPDVGRLHVVFLRENPTTLKKDFELLPKRNGKGRFIGSVMGIRSLDTQFWWGEGEMKAYLDGDTEFPTICGTGSEDYVGLSWGIQQTPFLFNGCSFNRKGFVSMYRWHLPDPIYWKTDIRVTIQQIGHNRKGLYERQDDWACSTFWYEPIPSEPLPKMLGVKARTADLWEEEQTQ